MNRRSMLKLALAGGAYLALPGTSWAKTYLTVDQARLSLWGAKEFENIPVTLSKEQRKAIKSASKVRVRNKEMNVWRSADGSWFILDQVIGKHENIDLAFGLTASGEMAGVEILTYRETYGTQVMRPEWRGLFKGKNHEERLKLGKQIPNISGATLSCRHLTDGVNRMCATWNIVLRHLP